MCKRMFALLALAISLFGTQCWAQTSCNEVEGPPCIQNTFSPGLGNNERVYDFTGTGDGLLVVHFVKVLTTFNLIVTVDHTIDGLAEGVFNPATTMCVTYSTNGSQCDEYDFKGDGSVGHAPHFVPVQGTDYRGLITLTLSYATNQTVHSPAFLHAPGASPVYTEDILTSYSTATSCAVVSCDPTMGGKTPGLSAVAAFDEAGENDSFCLVSPKPPLTFTVGHAIEVAFRLTAPSTDCLTAAPIRDKDARVSLAMTDSSGHFISFPPLRNKEDGNKFHFDHEDGVNELDLSTKGLATGSYIITVFSDEFSPQSVNITLVAGTDDDDPD
jgi:hypothetical protein